MYDFCLPKLPPRLDYILMFIYFSFEYLTFFYSCFLWHILHRKWNHVNKQFRWKNESQFVKQFWHELRNVLFLVKTNDKDLFCLFFTINIALRQICFTNLWGLSNYLSYCVDKNIIHWFRRNTKVHFSAKR